MARKKTNPLIVLGVIVLILYLYNQQGGREALLEDNYQYYDDFDSGFKTNLWTSYEQQGGGSYSCQYVGREWAPRGFMVYNLDWTRCLEGTIILNKTTERFSVYEQRCKPNSCSGTFIRYADAPLNLYPKDLKCEIWGGGVGTATGACQSRYGGCGDASYCPATKRTPAYPCRTDCSNTAYHGNGCYSGTYTYAISDVECGGYEDWHGWGGETGNVFDTRISQIEQPTTKELGVVSVSGGYLRIIEGTPFGQTNSGTTAGSVTSIKKFTNENIKIKFKVTGYKSVQDAGVNKALGKITFGSRDIDIPQVSEFTQRYVGTTYSREGVLEIKRYDDLDLSKWVAIVDGLEIADGRNDQPAALTFSNNIEIDYVKYQPYFSCVVDYNTEVVVRDKFLGGTTIDIAKLSYEPLKFCPQDLGVLIYSQYGLTDEIGSLTAKLAAGGTLNVPSDQYWQIDYITKYVTDMKERCNQPGDVYDVTSQKCVRVTKQELPTEEILACKTDKECIIDPKCTDATAVCTDSQCRYTSTSCTQEQLVNYVLVLKTINIAQPQLIIIDTDANKVTFNKDSVVAGVDFKSEKPTFTCTDNTDYGYITKPGCYKTTVNWGQYTKEITNGQIIDLSDYISLRYEMTGKGVYYGKPTGSDIFYTNQYINENDWENTFIVSFKNVLKTEIVGFNEKILLNTPATLQVDITNNIFELTDAGYIITTSKLARDIYGTGKQTQQRLPDGKTRLSIPLETNELGLYTIKVAPFFDMLPDQPYNSEGALSLGYYVTQDEAALDCKVLQCTYGECQSDGTCLITKENLVDCRTQGCSKGTCDQSTGTCVVTTPVFKIQTNGQVKTTTTETTTTETTTPATTGITGAGTPQEAIGLAAGENNTMFYIFGALVVIAIGSIIFAGAKRK